MSEHPSAAYLWEALSYIAGFDVAGMNSHLDDDEVITAALMRFDADLAAGRVPIIVDRDTDIAYICPVCGARSALAGHARLDDITQACPGGPVEAFYLVRVDAYDAAMRDTPRSGGWLAEKAQRTRLDRKPEYLDDPPRP